MAQPTATYRLQLREGMDFERARRLMPYLARLGISHIYLSPVFLAPPGSTHGYDVADFNRIEPALGGETGLDRLIAAARAEGLGLILDFVPNHMAATPHNPWWRDVLEWGEKSGYAHYFDIDWSQPKLLIPALGDAYGHVLERGDLALYFDAADGGLSLTCHGLKVPLNPPTYAQVLVVAGEEVLTDLANRFAAATVETAPELKAELAEAARDRRVLKTIEQAAEQIAGDVDLLHALHESQIWRLAHWRAARETLTYRRFFEIADLVGMRVEEPSVFEDTHELLLRLVSEGKLDGIRLDHIDGLAHPTGYLARLREAVGENVTLLVEKILEPGEQLPEAWPVAGTSGYDFISALSALFTDPSGKEALTSAYEDFTGAHTGYAEALVATKRRIFTRNLAGELDLLTQLALDLAGEDLTTRDYGPDTLRRAIIETASAMPVYRSYVDVEGPHDRDRLTILSAAGAAKHTREVEDDAAIDFIARLLLLDIDDPERRARALAFTTRFQQTTGPLMAKAVEDTLFYRYNRLVALNEVGGDPDLFGAPRQDFHRAMAERLARQPRGLSATSTHDTKRGEDARARLYAVSERPADWAEAVRRWSGITDVLRVEVEGERAPGRNDEWLFYQSLLGAWPADLAVDDADGLASLAGRMAAFMRKAVREAKVATSWTAPNAHYEAALADFVGGALDPRRSASFLADFARTIDPLIGAGAIAGLAQTLIKLTAPGVPDIYQGAEFWELSLVDPDNRRPVDFPAREEALAQRLVPEACRRDWRDGRVKLALTAALLAERRRQPGLFVAGDYLPLAIEGRQADAFLAYARLHGGAASLTLVPRRSAGLCQGSSGLSLADDQLAGTVVRLPGALADRRWRNPLGESVPEIEGRSVLPAVDWLRTFPVGFLVSN